MANVVYNRGKFKLATFSWDTDAVDVGVLLVNNIYVVDPDHNTIADINKAVTEAVGAGYIRKSIAAANRSANEDDAGDAANFRVDNGTVTWIGLNCGVDLRVILFLITGVDINDDANDLLSYYDTGLFAPINTNGGDVALNFNTDGALKLV